MGSEPVSRLCFDAFSSPEPVPTPHQVRGRLSLENAMNIPKTKRTGPETRADALGEVFDQLAAGLFKMPAWPDLAVE
jgi:hypothetical protein